MANFPGPNGRLAFMRFDADGNGQVWVANQDMSRQVQLTAGRNDGGFPAWSPDGTRIAFQSSRTDPDLGDLLQIQDIFTMRPDGTDVRKVTDSVGDAEKPSWSPDGRWLVYAADRADYPSGQGIWMTRSDGSGTPRHVTTLPAGSSWQEVARFSPDGSHLVFTEYRGGHILRNHRDGSLVGEQSALFTVRIDGGDLRQITPWGIHGQDGDWSPDGTRIVLAGQPTHLGNIGDVLMVNADGSHLVDLTQDHGLTGIGNANSVWYEESFNPAWSPDGSTIVFVHASYAAELGFRMGLQVMNPDGANRAWLSDGEEHRPNWGTAPRVP